MLGGIEAIGETSGGITESGEVSLASKKAVLK